MKRSASPNNYILALLALLPMGSASVVFAESKSMSKIPAPRKTQAPMVIENSNPNGAQNPATKTAPGRAIASSEKASAQQQSDANPAAANQPHANFSGTNLALNKPVKQSSDLVHPTVEPSKVNAKNATDGKTDGDFTHGSVTHTQMDPNAWLDIDLGKAKSINGVVVWNRTDCCKERLTHYWVFISSKPFAANDKAETLKNKPGVWAKQGTLPDPSWAIPADGVKGRFVRIQLADDPGSVHSALSLAEVQVFGK